MRRTGLLRAHPCAEFRNLRVCWDVWLDIGRNEAARPNVRDPMRGAPHLDVGNDDDLLQSNKTEFARYDVVRYNVLRTTLMIIQSQH
eukprot:7286745-Heterocapsa_arctica.AAC.1